MKFQNLFELAIYYLCFLSALDKFKFKIYEFISFNINKCYEDLKIWIYLFLWIMLLEQQVIFYYKELQMINNIIIY